MIGASMAVRAPRTRGLAGMAMDAIRRNNGTLLLPGAATPLAGGGFTYGNPPLRNYLDSAGTDLLDSVTQVDQPVGLVLDSTGVLGPELVSNPDTGTVTPGGSNPPSFSTTTRYGLPCVALGFNLSGAVNYASSNAVSPTFGPAAPLGTTLQIRYEVAMSRALVGSETFQLYDQEHNIYLRTITASDAAVASMFIEVMMTAPTTAGAGSPSRYAIYPGGTFSGGPVTVYLRAVSFKQLPGNHASQATTASKPLLRRGLVNRVLASGDMSSTSWTSGKSAGATVGALTTGPDGQQSARLVTYSTASEYLYQDFTNYPAVTGQSVTMAMVCNTATRAGGWGGGSPSGTDVFAAYDMGGGWWMQTVVRTFTVTTSANTLQLLPGSFFGLGAATVAYHRVGLFQGAVTAQQIIDAGGIPLTTTAAASSAKGNYWWQLDGSNDHFTTGITTGNEGWICAGFKPSAIGAQAMLSSGAIGSTVAGAMLRLETANSPQILVGNGTTREFIADYSFTAAVGVPVVVDGGWTASSMFVSANGGAGASTTKTVNCSTANTFMVGAATSVVNLANGGMSATVYTPVLPSAADRALIRRFVGSLQGQQL